MKIETVERGPEREVLIGMIVNPTILGTIAQKWGDLRMEQSGLFRSEWSNLVGGWCVRFHRKHGGAPGKAIQSSFERWAERTEDPINRKMIERFLVGLSDEYKTLAAEQNASHVLDVAGQHFNQVRLERLQRSLEAELDNHAPDRALQQVISFSKVELGAGACIDVLQDEASVEKAYADAGEVLVEYPGAAGQFFGRFLQRDAFIAFMAPEKRGKSFVLLDLAWRAMLQRRRTVLFVLGDMSEGQVQQRLGARAAKWPIDAGSVRYPRALRRVEGTNKVKVRYETLSFENPLGPKRQKRAYARIREEVLRSESPYFKLFCYSSDSASIRTLNEDLDGLARDGFVADVVVVDYADNIATTNEKGDDFRHRTNGVWKGLRKISQDRHCLVATATQSDASSYDTDTLTRKNFSEDKRKFAEVTGMAGINQSPEEQEQGIYRFNWLAVRSGAYDPRRCVYTASCLELANPCVRSCW